MDEAAAATNLTTEVGSGGGDNDNDDDDHGNYFPGEADSFYHQCGLADIPFHPEFRAAQVVITWVYPFLLLLGTLGNGVCVVVLGQLSASAWSSSLHLALLAVVDLLVLAIRCGSTWCEQVTGMNPSLHLMRWSDAMCKCYLFMLNVLLQLWPWLIVAVSVDLTIATSRPLKTYSACTRERARITSLVILILLICLNLNFFWTWGLRGGLCIYIEEFSVQFLNLIWPSIESIVKHILPLLVVVVSLIVTLSSLLRSRWNGASYELILRRYFLDLQALQQLQSACLTLVLLFVVVKAFTFSVELVNALEMRGIIVVPCEQYARFKASFTLVQTLRDASVYCFHSLKFLVYYVFCAAFRRHFTALMTRCLFCRKVQRTGSTLSDNCVMKNRYQQS